MELIVSPVKVPEITFNFDELKAEITAIATEYQNTVAVDIEGAKKDRARLNAFKKALNDRRIALSKEYTAPVDRFKVQVDELIGIIDRPAQMIDKRIKEAEAAEKAEKAAKITDALLPAYEAITAGLGRDESRYKAFMAAVAATFPKWLNKTVKIEAIQRDIEGIVGMAKQAFATLRQTEPEYYYEGYEEYLRTLDINRAFAKISQTRQVIERKRQREEEEKRRAEEAGVRKDETRATESNARTVTAQPDPTRHGTPQDVPNSPQDGAQKAAWVTFKAYMTTPQAVALAKWFKENNIQFGPA